MKDRREEAVAVLAKYHANGDPTAPIVQLQIREIVEDMAKTSNDNPWWNFKELVHTAAARYRLYMVIAMAFFGQWSGNNVASSSHLSFTKTLMLEHLLTFDRYLLGIVFYATNDCKCRDRRSRYTTFDKRSTYAL